MKENRNAGFTLIEILIAMMMSLIIITGVSQFLSVSSNNYQAIDKQVNMQVEAQSVVNAITDMILEANNVAYRADKKCLIIYYNLGETLSDGTIANKRTAEQKIIWLDEKNSKLYLFNCNEKRNGNSDDYVDAMGSRSNAQLFAEGIHSVKYTIPTASGTGNSLSTDGLTASATTQTSPSVKIEVELWSKITSNSTKEDGYTYKASNIVAPRNEIVAIP